MPQHDVQYVIKRFEGTRKMEDKRSVIETIWCLKEYEDDVKVMKIEINGALYKASLWLLSAYNLESYS